MTEATTDRGMIVPDVRSLARVTRSVVGYALVTVFMIISPLVIRVPLVFFVPAALISCTLRNGRKATVIAVLLASALLAAVSLGVGPAQASGLGAWEMTNFLWLLFTIGIPSLIISTLVRKGVPFGPVVLAGTGASAAGLILVELLMRAVAGFSPYQALVATFRESATVVFAKYREMQVPEETIHTMRTLWDKMAAGYMPAMLLVPTVMMFVLSLVMLSRLPAWRDHVLSRQDAESERLRSGPYLFRNLTLPDWLIVAFLAGGVSPLLTGVAQKAGGNLLAVVGFLYLLQGLAVFRSMLVTIGAGFVGVMIAYTTLALLTLSGIAPLLLAIAGLFDSFFDFRHFKRKDDSNESHID
jgi:Predicted membrane protein (DUF2232)